jgi:hypothetical protein
MAKLKEHVLPNIRKLFIPDPGYAIFDCDLSGADAQVVAWEANDEDLKKAFRSGVKIHEKNARDVFGDEYDKAPGDRSHKGTPKGKLYDQNKRAVHLTNYGGSAFTIARTPEIGWSQARGEAFQKKWFQLHPGIKEWHRRVQSSLARTRGVSNAFGYRRIYFDRIDSVLPEALAWIPQSTVALVTYYGAISLRRHPRFRVEGFEGISVEEMRELDRKEVQWTYVEVLSQVHDSLVFQLPHRLSYEYAAIREGLRVKVPYEDPLYIPWGISKSSISWGDCEDVKENEATLAKFKGEVNGKQAQVRVEAL